MECKLPSWWSHYARGPTYYAERKFLELYASQLAQAISQDDAVTLKNLLDTYGGIGLVDLDETSLLHYAVDGGSRKAFDVLIVTEGVYIDAQDENKNTALDYSLRDSKEDLALELVKKGADIHLVAFDEKSLYLVIQNKLLQVFALLIERGKNIDCCYYEGKTLLVLACEQNWIEGVLMLLLYGAQVDNRLVLHCFDTGAAIREIVSNFIFDEHKDPVSLDILVKACQNYHYSHHSEEKSLFFGRFLDSISEVTCVDLEIQLFRLKWAFQIILHIDPKHFQTIFKNFENVFQFLITQLPGTVYDFCPFDDAKNVENWTTIMNSQLSSLDVLLRDVCFYFRFEQRHPHDFRKKVANLISLAMNKDVRLTTSEVSEAYYYLGYSSLFKRMLGADIFKLTRRGYQRKHLMVELIFDVRMTLENVMDNPHNLNSYSRSTFDEVLEHFSNPQFNQYCSRLLFYSVQKKAKEMPKIPLLTELARNEARKHIINFFRIKNFRDFDCAVEKLDIAERYKKMLTYELKLY